jgi:hypothetical protein
VGQPEVWRILFRGNCHGTRATTNHENTGRTGILPVTFRQSYSGSQAPPGNQKTWHPAGESRCFSVRPTPSRSGAVQIISNNNQLVKSYTCNVDNFCLYFCSKKLDNIRRTWSFHSRRQTKPNPSFGPFSNGHFFSKPRTPGQHELRSFTAHRRKPLEKQVNIYG